MSCLMFLGFCFLLFLKKKKINLMTSHQATRLWGVGVFVVLGFV